MVAPFRAHVYTVQLHGAFGISVGELAWPRCPSGNEIAARLRIAVRRLSGRLSLIVECGRTHGHEF